MPQVSFYRLSDADPDSRLQFACRLTEKARSLGHRVFIQAQSDAQARQLSQLLWQYRPGGFLPHTLLADCDPEEPVAVGTSDHIDRHDDVLVNLAAEPCAGPQRFKRINEILCADDSILAAGRDRYRFYQAQGYQPETHKL
ncbi:MAG: DNA polymerase III subunit chi [Pseudohongiellaceae bacterium]|jgi:DNA polymerase-3 subunit chi